MTKTELQLEIQKVLDGIPENVLLDILNLLKDLRNQPGGNLKISHALRKIISEDKALLEKLAK